MLGESLHESAIQVFRFVSRICQDKSDLAPARRLLNTELSLEVAVAAQFFDKFAFDFKLTTHVIEIIADGYECLMA